MKGSRNYNRRFAVQSIVLFLVMSAIAFLGVYTSGSTAYRSANRLGTMTADYLHTQIDALLQQYNQILEDAVYMADTMLADGRTASDIEDWITSFSQEYNETMQYDENGLYGVIRGQGVYSSGWQPDETYDIYSRPWYRQALQSPGTVVRSQVYNDARTGTTMISLSKLLSDGESVLALDIRGEYLVLERVTARMEVGADYGRRVYAYTMDLDWQREGDTTVTVTAPETVAGITARISAGETFLEYDGVSLETGPLDESGLSPVGAGIFLMKAATEGFIAESGFDILEGRECLRLQGWTDDRIDLVLPLQSDAQLYKQAGNGVTVNVVEAIGKRLAAAHREVTAVD